MRAVTTTGLGGSLGAAVTELEVPKPDPRDILVQVEAVALNYRDLLVVDGIGRWRPPSGRILGSDACGVVRQVGADVEQLTVGDRVITTILPNWQSGRLTSDKISGSLGGASADGVMAEFVTVPANSVVRVDSRLAPAEFSTLPCAGLTAWHALNRASSLRPGSTILLQGTGGVSIFALQIAVAAGARVIITSSSDRKLARAVELGASATINYRTSKNWVEEAAALAPSGYDHVLDVGGSSTLPQSIECAAYEGTVSVIGLIGGLQATLDLTPIFAKNLRIDGIEVGSREMLSDLVRWYDAHCLEPVIDRIYELDDADRALEYLRSGTHFGKVVVRVS